MFNLDTKSKITVISVTFILFCRASRVSPFFSNKLRLYVADAEVWEPAERRGAILMEAAVRKKDGFWR